MLKIAQLLTISIVCCLSSFAHGQCIVLTQDYCPDPSESGCGDWTEDNGGCYPSWFFPGFWACGNAETKSNLVSYYRPASGGESGRTAISQIGTNTCESQRNCKHLCEQLPVSGTYACKTEAANSWSFFGQSHVVYEEAGVGCTGN
jgi:hypothetical protein